MVFEGMLSSRVPQEQEKHRLFLGFLVPFCMQLQQECTPGENFEISIWAVNL